MRVYIGMPHLPQRLNKRIDEVRKFIRNYIYYRRRKHNHIQAWTMAKNTL